MSAQIALNVDCMEYMRTLPTRWVNGKKTPSIPEEAMIVHL